MKNNLAAIQKVHHHRAPKLVKIHKSKNRSAMMMLKNKNQLSKRMNVPRSIPIK